MMNEGFTDAFDSDLTDYSKEFEESDKSQYWTKKIVNDLYELARLDSKWIKIDSDKKIYINIKHFYLHYTKKYVKWVKQIQKAGYVLYKVDGNLDLDAGGYRHSSEDFIDFSEGGIPEIVTGNFICTGFNSLTSLKGCPKEVGGYFDCHKCESLTSLEGAPEKVGGYFDCHKCYFLTSLKGCPKEVSGDFMCSECVHLISLEGVPEKLNGNFDCAGCTSLTSLEGSPKEVGEAFHCASCRSLASLEGGPEKVGGSFYCFQCSSLTSLKGCPKEVGGDFNCSDCKYLISLKGGPEKVGRNFDCAYCGSLTSLEGAPKKLGGDFRYPRTKITDTDVKEYLRKAVNEGFADAFDSSLTDYSKEFEESDKKVLKTQQIWDWLLANCCAADGTSLYDRNIRLTSSLKIDVLKDGISIREPNDGVEFGKLRSYRWDYHKVTEKDWIEELPEYIQFNNCVGDFDIAGMHLKTLRGCPHKVSGVKEYEGNFCCQGNQLSDLKYCPESVHGMFNCDKNPLTNADDMPEDVLRGFRWSAPASVESSINKRVLKILGWHGTVNEGFTDAFDSSLIDYSNDYKKRDTEYYIKNELGKFYSNASFDIQENIVKIKPTHVLKDVTLNYTKDYVEFVKLVGLNSIEVDGHLIINKVEDFTDFSNGGLPEKINGRFDCTCCHSLTSLKGSPKEVVGCFYCSNCKSLISLEGAPEKVGQYFSCSNCISLPSLEGGPKEVGGNFSCDNCKSLTSLKGAPEKVGKSFLCFNCDSLTSLEGSPKEVGEDFSCSNCKSLTSLEGGPEKVGEDFNCSDCSSLLSLEGGPKEVGGDFSCYGCKSLISLEGAPEKINGRFDCFWCDSLTSLKGSPKEVGGGFDCHDCDSLTSLKGAPKWVSLEFNCEHCKNLKSLEGAPKETVGAIYYNKSHISSVNEGLTDAFDSSLTDYSSDYEKNDMNYHRRMNIKNWVESHIQIKTGSYSPGEGWRRPIEGIDKDYQINDDFTISLRGKGASLQQVSHWPEFKDKPLKVRKGELPEFIQFDKCIGDFLAMSCGLTSLRGFPREVYGDFYITDNYLNNLVGGPKIVTGVYNCACSKLTSLEGAPEIIGLQEYSGAIFFNACSNKLTDLKGSPRIVYGNFSVESCGLTSLEGAPEIVEGEFNIKNNKKLTSLRGLPENHHYNSLMMNKKMRENMEHIDESLKDVFDSSLTDYSSDFTTQDTKYRDDRIKDWCNRHVFFLNKYREGGAGLYTNKPVLININEDGTIDVDGDMYLDHFDTMEDSQGMRSLPSYIQFGTVHGDFDIDGDKFKSAKGFPYRIEGLLSMESNGICDWEYLPKYVEAIEYDTDYFLPELNYKCRSMMKYFPDIIDGEDNYIRWKVGSLSHKNDEYIFKYLVNKYKGKVEYIETAHHSTELEGWDLNESFADAFDSDIVDYSGDFERKDRIAQISDWVEHHIADRSVSLIGNYVEELKKGWLAKKPHKYKYTIDPDTYAISTEGPTIVVLYESETELPYKFDKIQGDFVVNCYNSKLLNLNNMPNEVHGNFNITNVASIDNLIGSPNAVYGHFMAGKCQLKSIKGISKYIKDDIYLMNNQIQDTEEEFYEYLGNNCGAVFTMHNEPELDYATNANYVMQHAKNPK